MRVVAINFGGHLKKKSKTTFNQEINCFHSNEQESILTAEHCLSECTT